MTVRKSTFIGEGSVAGVSGGRVGGKRTEKEDEVRWDVSLEAPLPAQLPDDDLNPRVRGRRTLPMVNDGRTGIFLVGFERST